MTSRFVGVIWVLALAALALGISLYCLDGLIGLGQARPDRLAHLVTARKETGRLLTQLQVPGPVAILSLICGLGAVAAGLLLLKGVFTGSRERLAVLDSDASGKLSAQRRPLTQMLRTLADVPPEVSEISRVRLSLKRSGTGGHIKLRTIRRRESAPEEAKSSIEQAVGPLAEPFGLASRIRTQLPRISGEQTS